MAKSLATAFVLVLLATASHNEGPPAEFKFVRMEYRDHPSVRRPFGRGSGGGRGWWEQDWPEADVHFTQGIRRWFHFYELRQIGTLWHSTTYF